MQKVTYGTESSIMRDSNVNRQCYYTEVNDLSYTIAIPQPTLTERLEARTCELCGKVGPVVMRHVRKLNQLKGKTECDRLMLEKHRKTLVVCEKCYAKIHSHAK